MGNLWRRQEGKNLNMNTQNKKSINNVHTQWENKSNLDKNKNKGTCPYCISIYWSLLSCYKLRVMENMSLSSLISALRSFFHFPCRLQFSLEILSELQASTFLHFFFLKLLYFSIWIVQFREADMVLFITPLSSYKSIPHFKM